MQVQDLCVCRLVVHGTALTMSLISSLPISACFIYGFCLPVLESVRAVEDRGRDTGRAAHALHQK